MLIFHCRRYSYALRCIYTVVRRKWIFSISGGWFTPNVCWKRIDEQKYVSELVHSHGCVRFFFFSRGSWWRFDSFYRASSDQPVQKQRGGMLSSSGSASNFATRILLPSSALSLCLCGPSRPSPLINTRSPLNWLFSRDWPATDTRLS